MRIVTIFVLFLSSVAIAAQYAPIIAASNAAAEAKQMDAKDDADMVIRCKEGRTNVIMYNGVFCAKG